ncbi:MAG: MFS transporter [Acetobacteraceae bacterium]
MPRTPIFYGWWIVAACLTVTLVGNALGLFGAGVYLHTVVTAKGWPTALVSGAITLFYVVSAFLMIPMGSLLSRFGPRPVIAVGAAALALGVAGIGRVTEPWQIYAAFVVMGLGWACLSTPAAATTLAPWFERHQGRAVTIASLGASAGGMIGVPALLFGIGHIGFAATTTVAGLLAIGILFPLAGFVLRHRPQDMGLVPDGGARNGGPAGCPAGCVVAAMAARRWTRAGALRTVALRSTMATFGLALMVQVGFLTHQVTLSAPRLGTEGTAATVSATAAAALLGRLVLARFADHIDARLTAAWVLAAAAAGLCLLATAPAPAVFVGASILFGLTVGNVTTLAPIIVRREFGAASFGTVYGVASCGIQISIALGPIFYGSLHDAFNSYGPPLLMAAALDVLAAAIILSGRHKLLHLPA